MNLGKVRPPAILLLTEHGIGNVFVKAWFEKSRFITVETSNLFQVLEEISDFTVKRPPDVIILETASLSDSSLINDMIQILSAEMKMPVYVLSNSGNFVDLEESFKGDLAQLRVELDKIIPQRENNYQVAV